MGQAATKAQQVLTNPARLSRRVELSQIPLVQCCSLLTPYLQIKPVVELCASYYHVDVSWESFQRTLITATCANVLSCSDGSDSETSDNKCNDIPTDGNGYVLNNDHPSLPPLQLYSRFLYPYLRYQVMQRQPDDTTTATTLKWVIRPLPSNALQMAIDQTLHGSPLDRITAASNARHNMMNHITNITTRTATDDPSLSDVVVSPSSSSTAIRAKKMVSWCSEDDINAALKSRPGNEGWDGDSEGHDGAKQFASCLGFAVYDRSIHTSSSPSSPSLPMPWLDIVHECVVGYMESLWGITPPLEVIDVHYTWYRGIDNQMVMTLTYDGVKRTLYAFGRR